MERNASKAASHKAMATLSVRDSKNSPGSILRRICNARRPCPCTRLVLFFHNKATPSTPNSRPQPTHKPLHTPKGGGITRFFPTFHFFFTQLPQRPLML